MNIGKPEQEDAVVSIFDGHAVRNIAQFLEETVLVQLGQVKLLPNAQLHANAHLLKYFFKINDSDHLLIFFSIAESRDDLLLGWPGGLS